LSTRLGFYDRATLGADRALGNLFS